VRAELFAEQRAAAQRHAAVTGVLFCYARLAAGIEGRSVRRGWAWVAHRVCSGGDLFGPFVSDGRHLDE